MLNSLYLLQRHQLLVETFQHLLMGAMLKIMVAVNLQTNVQKVKGIVMRMMIAKEIFYVVITIATNNWDLVHLLTVVMTLIVSDIESHNHFT